jgi:hypothetical protein
MSPTARKVASVVRGLAEALPTALRAVPSTTAAMAPRRITATGKEIRCFMGPRFTAQQGKGLSPHYKDEQSGQYRRELRKKAERQTVL